MYAFPGILLAILVVAVVGPGMRIDPRVETRLGDLEQQRAMLVFEIKRGAD